MRDGAPDYQVTVTISRDRRFHAYGRVPITGRSRHATPMVSIDENIQRGGNDMRISAIFDDKPICLGQCRRRRGVLDGYRRR